MCEVKLDRAQALIGGLGGEKARWGQESERLLESLGSVQGDVLVCAMCVAYMGHFTARFREEAIQCARAFIVEAGVAVASKASPMKTLHPHQHPSCPHALVPSCPYALMPSCPHTLMPLSPYARMPSSRLVLAASHV